MPANMPVMQLCDSIMKLNKSIHSVTLINKQGRPIETTSRPKFTMQFPDFLNEMFLMQHVLQVSMGRDFDEEYGPINYHISERNDLTTLSLPIDDNVVLVTLDKKASPIYLARKISNLISEHKQHANVQKHPDQKS